MTTTTRRDDIRESACPVHFIWDGRGHGRQLVRFGFLGLLGAALAWAAARTFVVDALITPALIVTAASAVVYVAGQVLSRVRR